MPTGSPRYDSRPVKRVLLTLLVLLASLPARADEEPATLARALFLEKTSRDPAAALPVFDAVRKDAKSDGATRADASLGAARCLVALHRDEEAAAAWKALLADADAPATKREEARARLDEQAKAVTTSANATAAAREEAAKRREEQARVEQQARIAAAARLVESARASMRSKHYEAARDDLIQALERNPNDENATALLEEVGGYLADRGDLVRQAIRFVSSGRLADYRRLSAAVEALRESGRRALKEGRPAEAARIWRDAIGRIDESDFYADLADRRQELVLWLQKALADPRVKDTHLPEEVKVPAERVAPPAGAGAWRSEFFALLERIFASRTEGQAPIRFYDAAIPPNPDPAPAGGSISSKGIAASQAPGTLRRARWLERIVRAEISSGTWSGTDRLLERYDDLLVAQHVPSVLRQVDALVDAFPAGPPAPVLVEVRILGAKPGGGADAIRLLELATAPSESQGAAVARGRRLEEDLATLLAATDRLVPLAQATVRLAARHATTIRFPEATFANPLYADRDDPKIVIADKDASYGLDLDVYAESIAGREPTAALSVVATVKRPDRARVLPAAAAAGPIRVPTFLIQTLEADRRVPHAGTLVLFGLSNPFLGTGTPVTAPAGAYPDLVVMISVRPAGTGPAGGPDVPNTIPVIPRTPTSPDAETREYDLGPLGSDVADEPPPEDWPSAPALSGARAEAARASRDAWLSGWFTHRLRAKPDDGTIAVHDGKVTATLQASLQTRLGLEVESLARGEARVFSLDAKATEVPAERLPALLSAAGVPPRAPGDGRRLWKLDAAQAAALEERFKALDDGKGLFSLDTRLAARHTQLVTVRSIRSRAAVEDFRLVRGADGVSRIVPVNGSVEEGIILTVRPVAEGGGLTTIEANTVLARVSRLESWSPPGTPEAAPAVTLPEHAVERSGAYGVIDPSETLLFVVPAPGTEGARVVLIRVRHLPPR